MNSKQLKQTHCLHWFEATDIRGAFHNHTNVSDGRNTLEEMAEAADALNWEYLGIADHSQASYQAISIIVV